MVFLDDGDVAVIDRSGVRIFNRDGVESAPKVQHITWDPVLAEKGGYRALHAQGSVRTAARRSRYIAGTNLVDTGHVFLEEVAGGDRKCSRGHRYQDLCVRYSVARCSGGQISDRGDEQDSGRGRLRIRVSLSQSDTYSQHTDGCDFAIGRDRRHARRAPRSEEQRMPNCRHLQCSRRDDDTRGRRHTLHSRWPGDRSRVDKGIYVAARGGLSAGALSWTGTGDAQG